MPPIADDDARREISKRKRAGQLDDDILDDLVGQGLAEGHSRFLIATTILVPDDPAEHAAILERAGITADQASWIAEQTALRKMMIGMLVDAGFDEDSAALVVSHVIDEHHSQDEGVWVLIDHGASPEVAHAVCLAYERGVDRRAEDLATREIEDAGRSDASDADPRLRAQAGSPNDLRRDLAARGVDGELTDDLVGFAGVLHSGNLSPLADILERGRPRSGLKRLFRRR